MKKLAVVKSVVPVMLCGTMPCLVFVEEYQPGKHTIYSKAIGWAHLSLEQLQRQARAVEPGKVEVLAKEVSGRYKLVYVSGDILDIQGGCDGN